MIRRLSFVILALVVVAGYLFVQKTSSFNGFELADKAGKILRKPADYPIITRYSVHGRCWIRKETKCT